jgi:hypothetical protein
MSPADASRPLSEEELIALRDMLEKERRTVWFWSTLRVWAGWAAGIIGAYFAAKAIFIDAMSRLGK